MKRALTWGWLPAVWVLLACDPDTTAPDNQGYLTVDSNLVVDRVLFNSDDCKEVLPDSFKNIDSLPAGTAARVFVVATACYAAHVAVEDSTGKLVRSMDQYFEVYSVDGDKNRGMPGWLAWDGRDDQGRFVPKGDYLWRIQMRFGRGMVLKYRAAIVL